MCIVTIVVVSVIKIMMIRMVVIVTMTAMSMKRMYKRNCALGCTGHSALGGVHWSALGGSSNHHYLQLVLKYNQSSNFTK